jgi:hypothetical protein
VEVVGVEVVGVKVVGVEVVGLEVVEAEEVEGGVNGGGGGDGGGEGEPSPRPAPLIPGGNRPLQVARAMGLLPARTGARDGASRRRPLCAPASPPARACACACADACMRMCVRVHVHMHRICCVSTCKFGGSGTRSALDVLRSGAPAAGAKATSGLAYTRSIRGRHTAAAEAAGSRLT